MSRRQFRLLTPLASAVLLSATAHGHDHDAHQHDHSSHDHGVHQHDHDSHQHDHDSHQHGHADSAFAGLALSAALTVEGIYHDRFSGEESTPAGFGHGGAHDHGHNHDDHGHDHGFDEGFNLGHSELMLQGQTSMLEGQAVISLTEDDISLEEIFLATRALPHGLGLKGGKFLSDIGYINSRHPHAWNFIERPLFNEYLFGDHGLLDTGIQLTWSPKWLFKIYRALRPVAVE
ncbi:MAG: hypothetical protein ACTH3D_07445 [Halomonas sp.]|uniref:hypothetical protein n=1 Tax=Halomonas sp. TaxID=1486246 RepID=UPI003F8E7CBE